MDEVTHVDVGRKARGAGNWELQDQTWGLGAGDNGTGWTRARRDGGGQRERGRQTGRQRVNEKEKRPSALAVVQRSASLHALAGSLRLEQQP